MDLNVASIKRNCSKLKKIFLFEKRKIERRLYGYMAKVATQPSLQTSVNVETSKYIIRGWL